MNSHEDAPCDGEPATRYVARRDHLPQDGLGALLVHLMRCEVCEATVPGIAEEVRFDIEMVRRAARIERTRHATEDDVAVFTSSCEALTEDELHKLGRPFAVFRRVLADALACHAKVARHGTAAVLSAKIASLTAGRGLAADSHARTLKVLASTDARLVVELAPVHDPERQLRTVALDVCYHAPGEGAPVLACVVTEEGDDPTAVEAQPVVLRWDGAAWHAATRLRFPSSWRSPRLAVYRMKL